MKYTFNGSMISLFLCLILVNGICQDAEKVEVVEIDGMTHYYEIYGSGEPLLLLHGWCQSSKYWRSFVDDYKDEFTVYLIDLQGFGMSDAFQPDWSIESVTIDLNALLGYLELSRVKGIGLSFGGDILLQLSVLQPDLIESMVIIGSGLGNWNAKEYPDYMEYFSVQNADNMPELESYQSSKQQFHAALKYFGNYNTQISDDELNEIKSRVMIVYGDDDGYDMDEIMRVRSDLANSDLWMIPDAGHVANGGKNKKQFVEVSKRFLKE